MRALLLFPAIPASSESLFPPQLLVQPFLPGRRPLAAWPASPGCSDRRSASWSGPLLNTPGAILWTARHDLWTDLGTPVEHPEEIEEARKLVREPLVVHGSRAVELLPRNPSGESGIGRRRRSVRRLTSPLAGGRGGRVMRPLGSPHAGWIDRERHQYRSCGEPPDPASLPGPDGSPNPEGPLPLIPAGALQLSSAGSRDLGAAGISLAPRRPRGQCWASTP
jgi:hypothetical protein